MNYHSKQTLPFRATPHLDCYYYIWDPLVDALVLDDSLAPFGSQEWRLLELGGRNIGGFERHPERCHCWKQSSFTLTHSSLTTHSGVSHTRLPRRLMYLTAVWTRRLHLLTIPGGLQMLIKPSMITLRFQGIQTQFRLFNSPMNNN